MTPAEAALPGNWLPPAIIARIIGHWSAGDYKASALDKQHYHLIVEGDGTYVRGDHSIAENAKIVGDNYAAHTLGCNTGSIGISCASMAGAVEQPFNAGKAPTTLVQWNRFCQAIAVCCKFYKIPVTPKTVLTHAEVQSTLNKPQRGKWDFTRLAFDPSVVGAKACGDRLRADVARELKVLG